MPAHDRLYLLLALIFISRASRDLSNHVSVRDKKNVGGLINPLPLPPNSPIG